MSPKQCISLHFHLPPGNTWNVDGTAPMSWFIGFWSAVYIYVYIAYFHLDTSFRMELAIGLHILHVKHLRAAFGSDRERPRAAAQQHTKLRAARVPTRPENDWPRVTRAHFSAFHGVVLSRFGCLLHDKSCFAWYSLLSTSASRSPGIFRITLGQWSFLRSVYNCLICWAAKLMPSDDEVILLTSIT